MSTKKLQGYSLFVLLCGLVGAVLLPVNAAAQYRGAGTYFIVAKHSGMFLDVRLDDSGSVSRDGSLLQQYVPNNGDNQKFLIEPISRGSSYVTIKPKSGLSFRLPKCLDISSSSLAVIGVQQYACNGGTNQQFVIEAAGSYYKIRVRHSGFYFDVPSASLSSGVGLNQFPSNRGDNQLFQLIWLPS